MDTYVILRRDGWRSGNELGEAATRSRQVGDEEMSDDIRWIRSYVLDEASGVRGHGLHLPGVEPGGDPRARRAGGPAGRRDHQGGRHGPRAARPGAGGGLTGALAAAALALGGADAGHAFAVSLARAGPRPAASAAEARAHARVRARVPRGGAAGRVGHVRRAGPRAVAQRGRGARRGRLAACVVVMAHADSTPQTPGAEDNASGVGALVALAPRLRLVRRCDTWLVATGAEERLYTGRPDHLGALALVRRVRRLGRARDLRLALSLDEVGRGRPMWLRSRSPSPGRSIVARAAVGSGAACAVGGARQRDGELRPPRVPAGRAAGGEARRAREPVPPRAVRRGGAAAARDVRAGAAAAGAVGGLAKGAEVVRQARVRCAGGVR